MKLQRQLVYKYKGKKHLKYVNVIPEATANQWGWKAGHEHNGVLNDGKLIVTFLKDVKGR